MYPQVRLIDLALLLLFCKWLLKQFFEIFTNYSWLWKHLDMFLLLSILELQKCNLLFALSFYSIIVGIYIGFGFKSSIHGWFLRLNYTILWDILTRLSIHYEKRQVLVLAFRVCSSEVSYFFLISCSCILIQLASSIQSKLFDEDVLVDRFLRI